MSPLRAVPAIAGKLREWAFRFLLRRRRFLVAGVLVLVILELGARAYALRRFRTEAHARGFDVNEVGGCFVTPFGVTLRGVLGSGDHGRFQFGDVRVEWFPRKRIWVSDGNAQVIRHGGSSPNEGSRARSTEFLVRIERVDVGYEGSDKSGVCQRGTFDLNHGQFEWSCVEASATVGGNQISAHDLSGSLRNGNIALAARGMTIATAARPESAVDVVNTPARDLKALFSLVSFSRERALTSLRAIAESGRVRVQDLAWREASLGSVDLMWGGFEGPPQPPSAVKVNLGSRPVEVEFVDFRVGRVLPVHPAWCGRDAARISGTLRFDSDEQVVSGVLDAREICVEHERLADAPLRMRPLRIDFRLAPAGGERWRVFASAAQGEAKVTADVVVLPRADSPSLELELHIPEVRCQLAFEAFPTGSWTRVAGTELAGTIALDAKVSFTVGAKEDPKLDYAVSNSCRFSRVPQDIARDVFRKPFLHRFYGPDGSEVVKPAGPGTPEWTPYGSVGKFLPLAVTAMEDGTFFRHRGFHHPSLKSALIADLRAGAFLRGGSTVTMQLAKNLFLTRHKTLFRKLEEVLLTDYLEQTFTKEELLELYLNLIEFGPNVYGVRAASQYYFSTTPSALSLGEALFLISVLPSPVKHARMRGNGSVPEGWARYLRRAAENLKRAGGLEPEDIEEAFQEPIYFGGRRKAPAGASGDDP